MSTVATIGTCANDANPKNDGNYERKRHFVLAFLNHCLWSTQPIACRYLQVFAQPHTFDGMSVLATTKAAAAILIFVSGTLFPEQPQQEMQPQNGTSDEKLSTTRTTNVSTTKDYMDHADKSPCKTSLPDVEANPESVKGHDELTYERTSSWTETSSDYSSPSGPTVHDRTKLWTKISLCMAYSVFAMGRAATNVASNQFTVSYYISESHYRF